MLGWGPWGLCSSAPRSACEQASDREARCPPPSSWSFSCFLSESFLSNKCQFDKTGKEGQRTPPGVCSSGRAPGRLDPWQGANPGLLSSTGSRRGPSSMSPWPSVLLSSQKAGHFTKEERRGADKPMERGSALQATRKPKLEPWWGVSTDLSEGPK